MSIHYSIAKPYATAIFELAKAQDALYHWNDFLATLADVVAECKGIISHPELSGETLADTIIAAFKQDIIPEQANLVRLLVSNKRLNICKTIASCFETLFNEDKQAVKVNICSAKPLAKKDLEAIKAALTNQTHKFVEVETSEDPSLIGGMLIRMGDKVIDGSLKGQLQRLREHLKQ